jgi:signal peptidase I
VSATPAIVFEEQEAVQEPLAPGRVLGGVLRALRILLSIASGAAAALAAWVILPIAFGSHPLIVMSGSMTPALRTGDVVIDRRISPLDARIGDIVTFPSPEDSSVLISHRVRRIEIKDGRVYFETRGDANNAAEHWSVPQDGMIGRVAYHVPKLGYLVVWFRSRATRILLVVVPALLLGVFELVRIWRPRRKESDAEPG